jgi:hypothetical protein
MRPPIIQTLSEGWMLTPLTYGMLLMATIVAIVVAILGMERIIVRIKRRTAGETVRRMMM